MWRACCENVLTVLNSPPVGAKLNLSAGMASTSETISRSAPRRLDSSTLAGDTWRWSAATAAAVMSKAKQISFMRSLLMHDPGSPDHVHCCKGAQTHGGCRGVRTPEHASASDAQLAHSFVNCRNGPQRCADRKSTRL